MRTAKLTTYDTEYGARPNQNKEETDMLTFEEERQAIRNAIATFPKYFCLRNISRGGNMRILRTLWKGTLNFLNWWTLPGSMFDLTTDERRNLEGIVCQLNGTPHCHYCTHLDVSYRDGVSEPHTPPFV